MVAVSTAAAILYGVGLFALVFVPGIVTPLKGQLALALAGLLVVGLVWWIAALRLARPDSWWAGRFYGAEKLQRARSRYAGRES